MVTVYPISLLCKLYCQLVNYYWFSVNLRFQFSSLSIFVILIPTSVFFTFLTIFFSWWSRVFYVHLLLFLHSLIWITIATNGNTRTCTRTHMVCSTHALPHIPFCKARTRTRRGAAVDAPWPFIRCALFRVRCAYVPVLRRVCTCTCTHR